MYNPKLNFYEKLLILNVFYFLFISISLAQLPYTVPQYQIRKDSAVLVGTVTNYCNLNYDVKVNIYKPIGDNSINRPVAIFVHGGGLVSGEDFNEGNMNVFAMEFARRGYVGVSIDYREGVHLYPYGTGNPYPVGLGILANWDADASLYTADTAEIYRAAYRAQQDLKGVIRFMKKRNVEDSTNTCRYFLGSHSAGSITVLNTVFLDNESEKPSQAGALANAANPSWRSDGFWWFGNWVVTQINGPQNRDNIAYRLHNPSPLNYGKAACYARPDLGSIDGSLHTDAGYDTRVLGIAPMAGALIDTNLLAIQTYKPAIFFYHIANDLVVPYNVDKPFGFKCDLLQPCPNSNWPKLYGSNFLNNKLTQQNYPAAKILWTYNNGGNTLNSHDILPYPVTVADSVAKFFAAVLDTCTTCPPKTILATTLFNAK
ncbi:MAG: carboxylesterase family protein [Chitinophagaceae bacterium]|nr:carboxylesterase family protein [Chitinophagaceae bacterium]